MFRVLFSLHGSPGIPSLPLCLDPSHLFLSDFPGFGLRHLSELPGYLHAGYWLHGISLGTTGTKWSSLGLFWFLHKPGLYTWLHYSGTTEATGKELNCLLLGNSLNTLTSMMKQGTSGHSCLYVCPCSSVTNSLKPSIYRHFKTGHRSGNRKYENSKELPFVMGNYCVCAHIFS